MRKWSVIEMLPHLNRGIGSNNDTYINAVKPGLSLDNLHFARQFRCFTRQS